MKVVPKVFSLNFGCLDVNSICCQFVFYCTSTANELKDIAPFSKTYIYITLMNLVHNNMRNAVKTVFKFPEKNPCRTIKQAITVV